MVNQQIKINMMIYNLFKNIFFIILLSIFPYYSFCLERPDTIFPIFQFPLDKIPRIDGNPDDWDIVPNSYTIGIEQLWEDSGKHDTINRKNLDVKVKVGWVKGLNCLYFLYEAYDNYWDFSRTDLHNDTYEIVVDGDLSGGPLVDHAHYKVWTPEAVGIERVKPDPRIPVEEEHWLMHGVHAQNYHIFTPAKIKIGQWFGGFNHGLKNFPMLNMLIIIILNQEIQEN